MDSGHHCGKGHICFKLIHVSKYYINCKRESISSCFLGPLSLVSFVVIMNTSDCTDVDFEHLVSKHPAAIYYPLLNDKVLTKKETQQSSQHGLRAAGI